MAHIFSVDISVLCGQIGSGDWPMLDCDNDEIWALHIELHCYRMGLKWQKGLFGGYF